MRVNVEVFRGECQCGHEHSIAVRKIIIEPDAIQEIENFVQEQGLGGKIGIIADSNTNHYAIKIVESMSNQKAYIILLDAVNLHANEYGVWAIQKLLKSHTTALIAVGSGTIHDLTRYIANDEQIPFISVPTASSVDGFVSSVSAMTWKGFKVTLPGVAPLAVFADTCIFAKAPRRLIASGVADLLGKYTALLDWKVASLVTGEYICNRIVEMEEQAILQVVDLLENLNEGAEEAHEKLMYALLLSGLAMQMIGNSRPASGAEHHMSHLWEMHILNPEIDALHGEKVGIALALVCDTYKKILEIKDIENSVSSYQGMPYEQLKDKFQDLYEAILEENKEDVLEKVDMKRLIKCFGSIQEWVKALPSGKEIRNLLGKVHGKQYVEEIGLDRSVIEDSLEFSPYVRARLTLMRLMKLIK